MFMDDDVSGNSAFGNNPPEALFAETLFLIEISEKW
jgi:hypothetical protein